MCVRGRCPCKRTILLAQVSTARDKSRPNNFVAALMNSPLRAYEGTFAIAKAMLVLCSTIRTTPGPFSSQGRKRSWTKRPVGKSHIFGSVIWYLPVPVGPRPSWFGEHCNNKRCDHLDSLFMRISSLLSTSDLTEISTYLCKKEDYLDMNGWILPKPKQRPKNIRGCRRTVHSTIAHDILTILYCVFLLRML